jgi:hypothetical protein
MAPDEVPQPFVSVAGDPRLAFKVALAKFVVGTLFWDDVPAMAVEALVAGLDSPSLRRLAGFAASSTQDYRAILFAAAGELGLTIPSYAEASMTVARDIARRVIEGSVVPYAAACEVRHLEPYCRGAKSLRAFADLAYAYEDLDEHVSTRAPWLKDPDAQYAALAGKIVARFRSLLEEASD